MNLHNVYGRFTKALFDNLSIEVSFGAAIGFAPSEWKWYGSYRSKDLNTSTPSNFFLFL